MVEAFLRAIPYLENPLFLVGFAILLFSTFMSQIVNRDKRITLFCLWFLSFLSVLSVGFGIAYAVSRSSSPYKNAEYAAEGPQVDVECNKSQTSVVSITSPFGFRILNARATTENAVDTKSANASIKVLSPTYVTAEAKFVGNDANTLDCHGGGHGEVSLKYELEGSIVFWLHDLLAEII